LSLTIISEYGIARNIKGLTNGQGRYLASFKSLDRIRASFAETGNAGLAGGAAGGAGRISDQNADSTQDFQPLKKARDSEDYEHYTKTLPFAASDDVLAGMTGGQITGDGDFTGNEFDFEMLRRLLAEDYNQRTGRERDETSMNGIVFDPVTLNRLVKIGRTSRFNQSQQFRNLLDNLEQLAEQDYGVAYLYDDALPEEKFHQEDLRTGRTDARAVEVLKQNTIYK
jgi:hypothetical protein